jgi:hypothetical protein
MHHANRDNPEKRKYYMYFPIFAKEKNGCPLQANPERRRRLGVLQLAAAFRHV